VNKQQRKRLRKKVQHLRVRLIHQAAARHRLNQVGFVQQTDVYRLVLDTENTQSMEINAYMQEWILLVADLSVQQKTVLCVQLLTITVLATMSLSTTVEE